MSEEMMDNRGPGEVHVTPVQLPTRTKVFADVEAPKHSLVETARLKGRDKIFTYDQIEDVLSNKPGPVMSYYLTIEQYPESFTIEDFRADITEAQGELLEQVKLVKDWYDTQELLISGVNHADLQGVLKKLQGQGISRSVLDSSLKAQNVFTQHVGAGENEDIYVVSFRSNTRRQESLSCEPEHVVSLLLEDLAERVVNFDIDSGSCKSFAVEVFQPAMAMMFLLRAAIPPNHHSLKGVATDGDGTIEDKLAEEIRARRDKT